jgi:hypothetical protein
VPVSWAKLFCHAQWFSSYGQNAASCFCLIHHLCTISCHHANKFHRNPTSSLELTSWWFNATCLSNWSTSSINYIVSCKTNGSMCQDNHPFYYYCHFTFMVLSKYNEWHMYLLFPNQALQYSSWWGPRVVMTSIQIWATYSERRQRCRMLVTLPCIEGFPDSIIVPEAGIPFSRS